MRRRALLLTTTQATSEMEELAYALGLDLVQTVFQRRFPPDPQTFLGSGKLEDVGRFLREEGIRLVLVNGQLKPGQIHSLQALLDAAPSAPRADQTVGEDASRAPRAPHAVGAAAARETGPVEVYDRTRLILEIFRDRARSPEARLQVELAQLQYDMPLVREAIAREKRGERQAAMFGSGEFGVDIEYDRMKRRMAKIRRELDHIRGERGVRRKHRRRSGFHLVSLAGYTNAGKSSLLNAMSDGNVVAENRYFSTLSTKTARANSDRRAILVTDTVGFIEDLPAWMVEAFHSTLEEIALADVVLLVVDASDPVEEMARRLRSSLRTLHEFSLDDARGASLAVREGGARSATAREAAARPELAPILVALNKADRVDPAELDAKRAALEAEGLVAPGQTVAVSARTLAGLDALYARLYELIPDYDELSATFPDTPETEAAIAWLHDHTDVLDLSRDPTTVRFEAKRSLRDELDRRLRGAGARASGASSSST